MNFVSRLPRAAFRNTLLLTLLIALLPIPFMRSPAHSQDPASPPTIPDPPAPMPLPAGTPQEQAVAFADAMDNTPDNVAAWLGLYDALDIPVIAPDGTSLGVENADPIGPQYWEVWYTSPATADLGISLTDFGQLIVIATGDTDPTHDFAALLLQDIRESATSTTPRNQLWAYFVAERMTRGGLSPLDEAATPDQVNVDPALILLMGWEVIRGSVLQLATSAMSRLPDADAVLKWSANPQAAYPSQSSLAGPCEVGGDEFTEKQIADMWTQMVMERIRREPNSFDNAVKNVSLVTGVQVPSNTKSGTGVGLREVLPPSYLIALLVAGFQVTLDANPAPFVRTKDTGNWGDWADLKMTLKFDPKALPGVDQEPTSLCATYFAFKELGGTLQLPPAGPIKDARLTASISLNSDRVGFTDSAATSDHVQVSGNTSGSGELTTRVGGRPQPKEIGMAATERHMEYAVIIVLVLDQMTTPGGVKSLMVGSMPLFSYPSSASSALTEALNTMRFKFRLAHYQVPFTDWQNSRMQAFIGNTPTDVTTCNFTDPMIVSASTFGVTWTYDLSPRDATSGTFMAMAESTGNVVTDYEGTYTLHPETEPTSDSVVAVRVEMTWTEMCISAPGAPRTCIGVDFDPADVSSTALSFRVTSEVCPE